MLLCLFNIKNSIQNKSTNKKAQYVWWVKLQNKQMILSILNKPEYPITCFDKFFCHHKKKNTTRRQDPCEKLFAKYFCHKSFLNPYGIDESYKNQNGISASFTGRPWVELIATYSPVNHRRIKSIFKSQQIHLPKVSIDVAFKKHI